MTPDELRAARDDDDVRLVHADELARTDPPAAELIAVQCAIERGGLPRDQAIAARRREAELLAQHGARIANLDGGVRWWFRRGFVEHVAIDALRFLEHADQLLARVPLLDRLSLQFNLPMTKRANLDAIVLLEMVLDAVRRLAIPVLDLGAITIGVDPPDDDYGAAHVINLADHAVERLVATGTLFGLRGLRVQGISDAAVRALVDALRLDDLEVELADHRNDLDVARAVARPRRLAIRLPRPHELWADREHALTSRVTDLGELGSANVARPLRRRLRKLALRVDLATDPLNAIEDPAYAGLDELALTVVASHDARDALKPLLRAEHLALRVLRLAMPLDAKLVAALAAAPLMRTLEVLDLRGARGVPPAPPELACLVL